MSSGTIYGRPGPQRELWATVTSAATDLRGQLYALNQLAHHGADPDVVEAVRAALWAAHAVARRP